MKGQIEKIRPVKFREEIICRELDGAIQNNAGNNEKAEKGSCLPFPLMKGQRMLSEAGRTLRAASTGEKDLEKKHQTQLGCSRARCHIQSSGLEQICLILLGTVPSSVTNRGAGGQQGLWQHRTDQSPPPPQSGPLSLVLTRVSQCPLLSVFITAVNGAAAQLMRQKGW